MSFVVRFTDFEISRFRDFEISRLWSFGALELWELRSFGASEVRDFEASEALVGWAFLRFGDSVDLRREFEGRFVPVHRFSALLRLLLTWFIVCLHKELF